MKRLLMLMMGVIMVLAARVHGQGWSALGTGMNDTVRALAVLPNGDLIASGSFNLAGGMAANRIARWNGTSWSAMGTGTDRTAHALAALPNGDLIAGGSFSSAGGVTVNNIARWNGTSWSAMGTGMNGEVWALVVLPNGDLIAGGDFSTAGGVTVNRIARWNGTSWSALGTGITDTVRAVAVLPNGDLIAGGNFSTAGGVRANYIARWNGTSWSAMGTEINGSVFALAVLPTGDLIAGGAFTWAGGVPANRIARWNGTSWSAMGGMDDTVRALAVLPNGDLIAGGFFPFAGGVRANYIARWNGTSWSALGSGMYGSFTQSQVPVAALAVLPNGYLIAGGDFTAPANRIARWTCSASFVSQPASITRCTGESATFAAAGSGILSFQWRKDGVNIPGATSATYTIPFVRVTDAGSYDCVATALCGIATSSAATLTVKVPQVLTLPASQTLNVDQPVFFALETNPESPCAAGLAYQWQRRDPRVADEAAPNAWLDLSDGGGVLGTRSATLAIFRPAPGLATGYRCKITDACGCEADSSGVIYTNTVNFSVACPADFNADGGIDFGDVEAFFERWESGC